METSKHAETVGQPFYAPGETTEQQVVNIFCFYHAKYLYHTLSNFFQVTVRHCIPKIAAQYNHTSRISACTQAESKHMRSGVKIHAKV